MRDYRVGVPAVWPAVLDAVVAVLDGDCAHAGGLRGLHVAQVVADVPAARRREREGLRRVQQRRRMRLRMRRRVAADHAARGQAEPGDDALGEARRLVGDDAPGDVARREVLEQLRDAGKQRRVLGQAVRIVAQESVAHRVVVGMLRCHVEGGAQQSAGAARGKGTRLGDRQRREPARGAQPVDGRAEVCRGIGQRAVEVEQHCLHGDARHAQASRTQCSR